MISNLDFDEILTLRTYCKDIRIAEELPVQQLCQIYKITIKGNK